MKWRQIMCFLSKDSMDKLEKFYPAKETTCYSKSSIYIHSEPSLDVSIIIPCYNAAAYLDECLTLLLEQNTNYSMEILAVDDGSCDSTKTILQRYESIYPQIQCFYQANQGAASARNKAMKESKGKYLIFVDSDDKISHNYIEELVRTAKETGSDLVACSSYSFNESGKIFKKVIPKNSQDYSILIGTPWGKLYDRKLFEHILWPEGLWFEDTILAWLVFPRIQHLATISSCHYAYRSVSTNMTKGNQNKVRTVETIYVTDIAMNAMKNVGLEDWINTDDFYDLCINQFYINQLRLKQLSFELRELAFSIQADFIQKNLFTVVSGKPKHELYEKALHTANFKLAEKAVRMDKVIKLIRKLLKINF